MSGLVASTAEIDSARSASPCAHHGRGDGRVGAEDVCRLVHRRGLAPVVVAPLEHDALARLPLAEFVWTGPDRNPHEFDRGLRRHDRDK